MTDTISTDTNITNAPKKNYCAPMHTTEHILNQTMIRFFGTGRAFSAHVEVKKSKCDYHFSRNLTSEEIVGIETQVNQVIAQNLEVTAKYMSRSEAAKIADLSKLPEGASETLRLVFVGDYDVCPCIGVHVANTKEIGTFKIISTDFTEPDVLRVRWKVLAK
jgi:alanyl-tRNA synthetase